MNKELEYLIKANAVKGLQIWLLKNYNGNELMDIIDCIDLYVMELNEDLEGGDN